MKKLKRIVSTMLAVIMLITMLPQTQLVNVKASTITATASVPFLGHTTNPIKIGTKEQSEKWVQTVLKVENKKTYVFCLDLGKTCRTGDTFSYNYTTGTDAWETYSSESSNEARALYAKIGHWYYNNGNYTKKRWIYAQALIWAVSEGETSKTELTNVIKALNDDPVTYENTSYKSTKTAANLYSEIFDKENVSIRVRTWVNENNNRQKLFEVYDEFIGDYKTLSKTKKYRQRVTVYKEDELGNAVQGAEFTLAVKNVMELDDIKIGNGQESEEITDITGTSTFEMSGQTGQNGLIWWKITYSMESLEYGYVPAEILQDMDADEEAAIRTQMDNDGILYANDLTQNGAEQLADRDLEYQLDRVKNKYELKETSSGNENILVSEEYADGKEFLLERQYTWGKIEKTDGSKVWPEAEDKSYYNYSHAYVIKPLVNDNKKYTVTVEKRDGYSEDGKPYGDVSLQGARYQFFDDAACTKRSILYSPSGNEIEAPVYKTDEEGRFESDYLVAGKTYYLKELDPPEGYLLDPTVYEVNQNLPNVQAEFTRNVQTVVVHDEPELGNFSLYKYHTGEDGILEPEEGAQFQIYLKRKGSYEACSEYERDILTADKNGYAISKDLYLGAYVLHQIGSGKYDTIFIDDQNFAISRDGEVINNAYVNKDFTAYLRIVKKLKETGKTVLKPDTSYQIYKVDADGNETKITQSYSNGHQMVTTDTFTTDETGLVETFRPLPSATYRVYEIAGAEGTHKVVEYYEIVINSKNDNCKQFTDAEGNVYYEVELEYVNESTKGKFIVSKTGEMITSYSEESGFVYENSYLNGTEFELYAAEDIATADGQETVWFNKGDKVATITTGEGATFENDCNGICSYSVDENGNITVNIPIGKYELKESDAVYGYIYPAENTFGLEFKWLNFEDESVLNNTDTTDENGVVNVYDDRAKADISIYKHTVGNKDLAVPNTTFDFCTKTDIYNKDGEVIVPADTVLATVTTDKSGKAKVNVDVPLMDEGYTEGSVGLNSGDYYFKEVSVSDSYFLDETPVYVHLEYKDSETPVITAEAVKANVQTEVEVSKVKLSNNEELSDAHLEIKDSKGNVIISWISGNKESIKLADIVANLQYENLSAEMDEKGNLIAHGLLHGEEYSLVETKPTDGFVTADTIKFKLEEEKPVTVDPNVPEEEVTTGEATTEEVTTEASTEETTTDGATAQEEATTEEATTEAGNENDEESVNADTEETENISRTAVYVYNVEAKAYEKSADDKVVMKDDTTKVYISKKDITNEAEQAGNQMEIRDDAGNLIESWTSTNEPRYFEQKFVVGKQYTLIETKPVDGYTTATSVDFVIQDTGNIQTVTMTNTPTQVEFSKKTITGSEEIPGCHLKVIRKSTGEEVENWVSTDKAHVITGKLIIGETYIMSETKPADGYVTATDIEFVVTDNLGELQTVTMKDDTTKLKIVKVDAKNKSKKLPNAEFELKGSKGGKVVKVKTDENGEAMIEGVLIAGETYTIKETKAPSGYELAADITYKIKDTGDIQIITVKDKAKTTKTGVIMKSFSYGFVIITILVSMALVLFGGRKKRVRRSY